MATREQMFTALRAADAAGATEDARRIAQMIAAAPKTEPEPPMDPAEGMSTTDKVLAGIGGGLSKMRDELFPPASPVEALTMQPSDNGRARKESLATYNRYRMNLGTAGAVGEAIPEMVASAAPIGRAGAAISKIPMLAKTLGRLAPAAGDIAANAGYAAATADEGQRGSAALAGGAGAAGGRLIQRSLGGIAGPFVSKDARTLIDAGVTPTPGQLFDGPVGNVVRGAEDMATSIPPAGWIIKHARARSISDYGNAEINAALRPLGVRVRGSGAEAVEQAQRVVSTAYDRVLPQTFIRPEAVVDAVKSARTAMEQIPLLSTEQQGEVIRYAAQKITPAIQEAVQSGKPVSGEVAKAVDAEIGFYARKYTASPNPSDHPMGEAFYELQASLRGALEGHTPGAKEVLAATNTAYRNMLPVLKAADRTASGEFTPRQLNRAAGQFGQTPSALNRAGQNVLPSTVPDSGTAGRALLGAAAAGGISLGGPAYAAAVAAAMYSRVGMNVMLNGLTGVLPSDMLRGLRSLPPERAAKVINQMVEKNPGLTPVVQSIIPQVMREYATQEQR